MPSKKLKPSKSQRSPWKAAREYFESELAGLAVLLAKELTPGARVLLNGPMGSGKSTFSRALIKAMGIQQQSEGSPSYAIAHEYKYLHGSIVHIDLYRLKTELEIEEAGVAAYFWEGNSVVLVEWLSSFPAFEKEVILKSGDRQVWSVDLAFAESPEKRILEVRKI